MFKVKKVFECGLCGYTLSRKSLLEYHDNAQHMGNMYQCNLCDKSFRYSRNLVRHKKKIINTWIEHNVGENITFEKDNGSAKNRRTVHYY